MAQQTTSTTESRIIRTREVYNSCTGNNTITTATVTKRQLTIVKNLPEHRDKPVPLYLNPTPRQLVYTRELKSGEYSTETIQSGPSWCGQGKPGYTKTTNRYNVSADVNFASGVVFANPLWGTKMRLKIKNEAINLGNYLAEYRETAGLFKGTASFLYTTWLQLRHRGYHSSYIRNMTMDDILKAFLFGDWALRPLLGDLSRSMEKLTSRLDEPVHRKFKVTAKDYVEFDNKIGRRGADFMSARAVVYVHLDATKTGWIPGNIFEAAWNGIPFSFVADWMFNIGDSLSAIDALKAVNFITGTVTYKRLYWHEQYLIPDKNWDGGVPRHTYESYKRDVIASIPMDKLSYQPSTSYRNVAQGLALLKLLR